MSITRQVVSADSLLIEAGDRSVEVTKADVIAMHQATSGNRASRIMATIAAIKARIADELGRELVDPADIEIKFDEATGRVLESRWGVR